MNTNVSYTDEERLTMEVQMHKLLGITTIAVVSSTAAGVVLATPVAVATSVAVATIAILPLPVYMAGKWIKDTISNGVSKTYNTIKNRVVSAYTNAKNGVKKAYTKLKSWFSSKKKKGEEESS